MHIKHPDIGLGIWFRDDIRNILRGTCDATLGVLANVPENQATRAYRAGFENAIVAVAAAFGLTTMTNQKETAVTE